MNIQQVRGIWPWFLCLVMGCWLWSVAACTDVLGTTENANPPDATGEQGREENPIPPQESNPQEANPEASTPERPNPSEPSTPDANAPDAQGSDLRPHEPTHPPEEKVSMPETPKESTPPEAASTLSLRAMSFNIRYGIAQDGDNHWNLRKSMVFDVIRKQNPDFLGMQEAWKFQFDEILQAVPGYQCFGKSRKANTDLDEWSPICFREARWKLDPQEQGVFWLSETPDVPGSQSWNSSLPRIATWARLIEKSSQRGVYLFNTHYDHMSQDARLESSKLISRRIAGRLYRNDPVVLMGDFNADEKNDAIQFLKGKTIQGAQTFVLLEDTFRMLHPTEPNAGTFHSWSGTKTGARIDYIFVIKGWPQQAVTKAEILYDNVQGRYPSDHFPIQADISFGTP